MNSNNEKELLLVTLNKKIETLESSIKEAMQTFKEDTEP